MELVLFPVLVRVLVLGTCNGRTLTPLDGGGGSNDPLIPQITHSRVSLNFIRHIFMLWFYRPYHTVRAALYSTVQLVGYTTVSGGGVPTPPGWGQKVGFGEGTAGGGQRRNFGLGQEQEPEPDFFCLCHILVVACLLPERYP